MSRFSAVSEGETNRRLKLAAHLFAVFLNLPLLGLFFVFRIWLGDRIFAGFSQLLSLIPGNVGSYLRIGFYRFTMTACERDCSIGFGTLFSQVDTEIADGVYIGPQCNIGSCRIGCNSLIASGVHILSGSAQHGFESTDVPIQQQHGEYRKISVGEDCWIGNGSIVMADIGDKCVIGAGSVVTSAVPDFSIMAGNPARLRKSRKNNPSAAR